MEAYFLDVGQANACIILLGDQRAIIVDAGKHSPTLIRTLETLNVTFIERLVITHNHDDHCGAAPAILSKYARRIGNVCLIHDSIAKATSFVQTLLQAIAKGEILQRQIVRIERKEIATELYSSESENAYLFAWAPSFAGNLQASSANPNETSAVLEFRRGSTRVFFGGDAANKDWREIHGIEGPIDCDILVVPHHGGLVAESEVETDWLYKEGIRTKYAIVSVGTSNRYSHPRQETIAALRRSGSKILCTQITSQCCDVKSNVIETIFPGRAASEAKKTTSGNPKNVACAGTVRADILLDRVEIHRLNAHQSAVARMTRRMCI